MNSRHLLLASVATAIGGLLGVLVVASGDAVPAWVKGLVSLTVVGAVVVELAAIRRVQGQEIQSGYCRMDYMAATFTRDPENRFPTSRAGGSPWDLRGLWRLDDAGHVERNPDPDVLPPGHYPSPNRPGELELWTGAAWSYRYRQPHTPFTEVPS